MQNHCWTRKDRGDKAALYAEASIGEYWIVKLVEHVVEIYRHPRAGKYQTVTRHQRGDIVCPAKLPGVAIAVAEII